MTSRGERGDVILRHNRPPSAILAGLLAGEDILDDADDLALGEWGRTLGDTPSEHQLGDNLGQLPGTVANLPTMRSSAFRRAPSANRSRKKLAHACGGMVAPR